MAPGTALRRCGSIFVSNAVSSLPPVVSSAPRPQPLTLPVASGTPWPTAMLYKAKPSCSSQPRCGWLGSRTSKLQDLQMLQVGEFCFSFFLIARSIIGFVASGRMIARDSDELSVLPGTSLFPLQSAVTRGSCPCVAWWGMLWPQQRGGATSLPTLPHLGNQLKSPSAPQDRSSPCPHAVTWFTAPISLWQRAADSQDALRTNWLICQECSVFLVVLIPFFCFFFVIFIWLLPGTDVGVGRHLGWPCLLATFYAQKVPGGVLTVAVQLCHNACTCSGSRSHSQSLQQQYIKKMVQGLSVKCGKNISYS